MPSAAVIALQNKVAECVDIAETDFDEYAAAVDAAATPAALANAKRVLLYANGIRAGCNQAQAKLERLT